MINIPISFLALLGVVILCCIFVIQVKILRVLQSFQPPKEDAHSFSLSFDDFKGNNN